MVDMVAAKLRDFSKHNDELKIKKLMYLNKEKSNGNSFKFDVTLIIAFFSLGYNISNYVENNPVSDHYYLLLRTFVPMVFTTFGLILYIIFKGISLELSDPVYKKGIENVSAIIFVSTFRLLLVYILYYIISYFAELGIIKKILSIISISVSLHFDEEVQPLFQSLIGMLFFAYAYPKIVGLNSLKKESSFNFHIYIFFAFIIIGLSFIGAMFSICFFTGDIKVEMNDIYSVDNNNNLIPIDLVNTGYNGDITVNITENKMDLDSIKLHSVKNDNDIIYSKYLRSSTLDYGRYKVYINTTNLTEGIYELSVTEEFQKNTWTPIMKSVFGIPNMKKTYYSFYIIKTD